MDNKTVMERARELVSRMTLDEMASQLSYQAPAIERLGIPEYNWWNEALHGVARAGVATMFPQAIGLAAMFDEKLLGQIAQAIACEARAKYNAQSAYGDRDIYKGLTFWSPNINIFRDPRWGRGHETYGEDPFLTARLGVEFVKKLQGDGEHMKAAACAKHFAVHSGPEDLRHEFDALVCEKDLWETYLPAFEALVNEAGVESVMGAYNRVNGEPACGSNRLLAQILRGQWKFEGHVVSDCWAIRDFHTHHKVTASAVESAAMALKAGCDLNCGITYLNMMQAYEEGMVTKEEIAESAARLMATRIKLGILGDEGSEHDAIPYDMNDCDEHADLALEAARRSMVLLKNDGILPLKMEEIKSIAVIGPNADNIRALEGNYNGTSSRNVTFLEGLRAKCQGKVRINYSEGCHLYEDVVERMCKSGDRLAEAVAAAKASDVAVLCLGLDVRIEGEENDHNALYKSGDKADLELPAVQRKLVEEVAKAGKPMVIILAAGSALRVEEANAVLAAWYPGQAGGTAAAQIIFGEVSPSGKLPVTFYQSVDDLPDFCDYSMKNRTYRYYEGRPLYPFGYGLSYCDFELEDARIDGMTVRAKVTNRGEMKAAQVAQVYIRDDESMHAALSPSLCGFLRVSLKPGESKEIEIDIPQNALTVVDEAGNRFVDGKTFSVYVGFSQPDERSAELTGQRPTRLSLAL
ncbi:MAG: glycoside hydrolase family 3 C-terminal domain-containing protein [Christensenellales bacterium]|jgi:beta-glucosidase